jgi:hypothetical protein
VTQTNTGLKGYVAGEALEAFRRVKLNSSNQVVYAGVNDRDHGITEHAAASGDHVTVRLRNMPGTVRLIAAGACSALDVLYGAASGKVDDALTGAPGRYLALEAALADGDEIECMPLPWNGGLLHADVADGTILTDSTTETALATRTISGADLQAGDVIHIVGRAYVLEAQSTDTLTCKIKLGTEVIVATAAVNSTTGDIVYFDVYVTVRVAGASGKLSACGLQANGVPGTAAGLPFRLDEASEDISGDIAVAMLAAWSVAHADNQVHSEDFIVELIRR